MSLIVEFVLPCAGFAEFQHMAQDWYKLKALSMSGGSPAYHPTFEAILARLTGTAKTVRLRVNGNSKAHTWDTREFRFSPQGIVPVDLDRQPNFALGECQTSGTVIGKFAINHASEILASNYAFDSQALRTPAASIDTALGNVSIVLTLGKDVLGSNQRDDVRFSLSLNSCTACHGPETKTEFHQINQRTRGQASLLSGFLTGSNDCAASGKTAGISYCAVPTSSLLNPNCNVTAVDRQFNDLLRRHLYLYTVLHLTPADDWQKALQPFAAYQIH